VGRSRRAERPRNERGCRKEAQDALPDRDPPWRYHRGGREDLWGWRQTVAGLLDSLAGFQEAICVSRGAHDQVKNKLERGVSGPGTRHGVENISEFRPGVSRRAGAGSEVENDRKILVQDEAMAEGGLERSGSRFCSGRGAWWSRKYFEPAPIGRRSAKPLPYRRRRSHFPDKPVHRRASVREHDGRFPSRELFPRTGFTEQIITSLSKIFIPVRHLPELDVHLTRGKPVKVQQVGEELGGPITLLEGSVQKIQPPDPGSNVQADRCNNRAACMGRVVRS